MTHIQTDAALPETDRFTPRVDPASLPEGEAILWEGRPRWQGLALSAFGVRVVTIYFAALLAWRCGRVWHETGDPAAALAPVAPLAVAWLLASGLLCLLAGLMARSTRFTLTDRRLVMRYGVALPAHLNIPLDEVEGAGLHLRRDGSGDLPLRLSERGRPYYAQLWPYARPWRLGAAEPMLRAIPDAERVAGLLARALAATEEAAPVPAPVPVPAPEPRAAAGARGARAGARVEPEAGVAA